jgi:hypothetical protein
VRIRSELNARVDRFAAEYSKSVADARRAVGYSFAGFVMCSVVGTAFTPVFLGCAVAAVAFVTNAGGPRIRGLRRSALLPSKSWVMQRAAEAANEVTDREVASLGHSAELASIVELVLRESTLDHSESQVARRITVAFFLLGYVPLQYSASERTLVFSDGDERVLVRFRHRDGVAVNVTVPQKLAELMRTSGVKRSYLFCSPGLSGNAATFAAEHGIHAYTIETMNTWIEDTLAADYAGPDGDILAHLDTLKSFMAGLSRALPEPSRVTRTSSSPRRRRRTRWW